MTDQLSFSDLDPVKNLFVIGLEWFYDVPFFFAAIIDGVYMYIHARSP